MKIIFKLIVFLLTFLGLCILYSRDVKSADLQAVNSYEVTVNIDKSGFASISINLEIQNNDSKTVLSGKEFLMPFTEVKVPTAKLNGNNVEITAIKNKEKALTQFRVDFGSSVLKKGEKGKLEMIFKVEKAVSEIQSVKMFTFYNNDFGLRENGKFKLIYPKEYGDISFISSANYKQTGETASSKELTFANLYSLMIVWGNSYYIDLENKFTISPSDNKEDNYLLNLIPESLSQEVAFKEFVGIESGLFDKFANRFAFVELNQPKIVSFSARVKKSALELSKENFQDQRFEINKESELWSKILNVSNISQDPKQKLENVNKLLVTTSELKESKKYNSHDRPVDIWNKYKNSEGYSPFEFCYVMSAFSEDIGVQSKINYGYITLPQNFSIAPHIWCEFKIGDSVFLADPYLEKETGITYFGQKSDFDRIWMGTWSPELSYINALGLLSDNDFSQNMKIVDLGDFIKSSDQIILDVLLPKEIVFGQKYTSTFLITNNTSRFIPIKDIKVDGLNESDVFTVNNFLYPAILPNYTTYLELTKRELDFRAISKESKVFELTLDDSYVPVLKLEKPTLVTVTETILNVFIGISSSLMILILLYLIKLYHKMVIYQIKLKFIKLIH